MEWVVFRSDLLAAIWDGRELGSEGGTWQAIRLARKIAKPIFHIDTEAECLKVYPEGETQGTGLPLASAAEIVSVIV